MDGEILKLELAGWTVYDERKKQFKSATGWSKRPSIFMKKEEAEEEAKKYKNCIKKDVHFVWLHEY